MANTLPLGRPRELPLLEIRKRVLFPGVLLRLQIGRAKSVKLVESIWDAQNRTFKKGSMIGVCTVQREADGSSASRKRQVGEAGEAEDEDPAEALEVLEVPEKDGPTVYRAGTVARVLQLSRVNSSDNQSFQFSLLVEGVARMRVNNLVSTQPFHVAQISWLADEGSVNDTEVRALAINVREIARNLLELQRKRNSPSGKKTKEVIENLERAAPGRLADLLSANMDADVEEKQSVLGELHLVPRLRRTLELLNRQVEVFKISDKIQSEVEGKLKSTQREYYLRQQLRAINDELGQMSGKGGPGAEKDEMELLEENLAKVDMPEEARLSADRELQRLKQMQPSQPEYSVIRTFLELMAELPWDKTTKDNLDVVNAREVLDADHHALDKVKKRIIEFLAVRSLKNDMKGPILCLAGPPGVGKTSLGKSVADALGRKFRRIALGGVRDEAEIRGHRRTYIGALPGNIVTTLKKAGTNNPVVLLDEIDKLGRDMRGDPASALLEVLDPEQNDSFVDHYLNVPFDLSKVMFIATANRLDTIPAPLLDRMEIIELPGYTMSEKHQIAVKHLVPKQMERHGIAGDHIEFTPSAVDIVIDSYTREAGVRNLDREIAALCRFAAVKVAESRDRVLHARLEEAREGSVAGGSLAHLHVAEVVDQDEAAAGRPIPSFPPGEEGDGLAADHEAKADGDEDEDDYESEIAQRTALPGVSTGMAWTQVGGEILFIEAWLHRGNGRVQLTGQLGKVMEESVRAALSFVRGHLNELNLNQIEGQFVDLQTAITKADLHVHFPAGGVPKDGPSAGVAVTAAILSALTGRCVRPDTACTGEITLRGLVLPVGGIKEKVLAAHRAGIKRIVLPKRNSKDVIEIPEEVRAELEIVHVDNILDAMAQLFEADQKVTVPSWIKEIDDDERKRKKASGRKDPIGQIPGDATGSGGEVPPHWSAAPRGNHDGDHDARNVRDLCGPILESSL
ncbi:Lon protease 2 (ATP-dependent protease La 2) [Durusdinium trenchii]|uniref:Lon protease homolog n=1 Tax=Durusdinium trenchii TaxID=1381693 RepID=A0ABP0HNG5_9DINO